MKIASKTTQLFRPVLAAMGFLTAIGMAGIAVIAQAADNISPLASVSSPPALGIPTLATQPPAVSQAGAGGQPVSLPSGVQPVSSPPAELLPPPALPAIVADVPSPDMDMPGQKGEAGLGSLEKKVSD